MSPTGSFSRDPIGFKGSEWSLYEYCDGNAIVKTDPDGLCGKRTDDECCDDAKKAGLNEDSDSKSNGGVICCDGRKVSCAWGVPKSLDDKDAKPIALKCIKKHEDDHHDDITCDPKNPLERPLSNTTTPEAYAREECRAYTEHLRCLLGHGTWEMDPTGKWRMTQRPPECQTDSCVQDLEREVNRVRRQRQSQCNAGRVPINPDPRDQN